MRSDRYIIQGHMYSILRGNYLIAFLIIFATTLWKNRNFSSFTYIRKKKER